MRPFVGREDELAVLRSQFGKPIAAFVVIRGRRRIGKSRLVLEFGKDYPCHIFSGLPPVQGTSRTAQLDHFAAQMSRLFDLPRFTFRDWGEAFWQLSKLVGKGRVVLALDEISWIGSKDPEFLGHLKTAWDLYFSKNPDLMLIVCGSVSSWIEKNILSATGFVGRISLDIVLKELPLREAKQFWDGYADRVDPFEIFKVLAVTGGVPRYLEEIQPHLSAEENIRSLCFSRSGLLFDEFNRIFSDLFYKRVDRYANIVECLSGGSRDLGQIADFLKLKKSGVVSGYLRDLQCAGFISSDLNWDFKTGKFSKKKNFRLSDNYLRFYMRYILPHREQIEAGLFDVPILSSMSGWEAVMGLQFENLVLNNWDLVLQALRISKAEVVMFGPYLQRKTKLKKGCQIDLLIQSRYRTIYLCEMKFQADPVGVEVIAQLKVKQQQMVCPRGWSIRRVLIHVNGVTQGVRESQDIDHIIDFSQLL